MQAVQLHNRDYTNIFKKLSTTIKDVISKYKLSTAESELDEIIKEFEPLISNEYQIINNDEVKEYDTFLAYLESLEDYLENLEDLGLRASLNDKLNRCLNIVTVLHFNIAGAISDYRILDHKCS